LLDVGFESSVLSRAQTRRRAGFSKRNDVVIDEVFVVASVWVLKFAFLKPSRLGARVPHLLPMEVKVGCIDESLPMGKICPSPNLLRLQKDHSGTVFVYGRSFLAQITPADVGTLCVVTYIDSRTPTSAGG